MERFFSHINQHNIEKIEKIKEKNGIPKCPECGGSYFLEMEGALRCTECGLLQRGEIINYDYDVPHGELNYLEEEMAGFCYKNTSMSTFQKWHNQGTSTLINSPVSKFSDNGSYTKFKKNASNWHSYAVRNPKKKKFQRYRSELESLISLNQMECIKSYIEDAAYYLVSNQNLAGISIRMLFTGLIYTISKKFNIFVSMKDLLKASGLEGTEKDFIHKLHILVDFMKDYKKLTCSRQGMFKVALKFIACRLDLTGYPLEILMKNQNLLDDKSEKIGSLSPHALAASYTYLVLKDFPCKVFIKNLATLLKITEGGMYAANTIIEQIIMDKKAAGKWFNPMGKQQAGTIKYSNCVSIKRDQLEKRIKNEGLLVWL